MQSAPRRPVNQKLRIDILRLLFLLLLPLLLLVRPVMPEAGFAGVVIDQIGIQLVIIAVLGRFWAILYSGGNKNRRVVQDGPYAICRHPLYLFSTIGVAGFGLMVGSLLLTLLITVLTGAVLAATARGEESYLRSLFGPDYDVYASRVPMIWPDLTQFQSSKEITVRVQALRVNFQDAIVFLSFIPIAALLQGLKHAGYVPTFPLF